MRNDINERLSEQFMLTSFNATFSNFYDTLVIVEEEIR
jgi:hypothetical protein